MIIISRMLMKYMQTPVVQSIFSGLRPAVVGLLLAATLLLMNRENFSSPNENAWQFWISVIIFFVTFVGVKVMKISPIKLIIFAGFAGLLLLY